MGVERKERIRKDHVGLREVFKLEFCTPRYIIIKEMGLDRFMIR